MKDCQKKAKKNYESKIKVIKFDLNIEQTAKAELIGLDSRKCKQIILEYMDSMICKIF